MQGYNSDNPRDKFKVGDLVMYHVGAQLVGNMKKSTSNWTGPFEMTSIWNDGVNASIVHIHDSQLIMPKINTQKLKIWRPKDEVSG